MQIDKSLPVALAMIAVSLLSSLAAFAAVGAAQQAVIDHYAAAAKAADPGFKGFSADRGHAFFLAKHDANADTPSCSTCHTADPRQPGQTRVGKAIDPMAVSVNPQRFTDLEKIELWFRRNCNTVLGRECTVLEKGDYVTFMASQ
jgi:cytochrome c peroxidase